ncbi:hypothetical protein BH09ACT11_BH09ACT11_15280 [soil metagenome]
MSLVRHPVTHVFRIFVIRFVHAAALGFGPIGRTDQTWAWASIASVIRAIASAMLTPLS